MPPQERLRRRGDLLWAADFLKTSADLLNDAGDGDRALARGRDVALDVALAAALARPRTHIRIRARDRAHVREVSRACELARELDVALDVDPSRARELARELDLTLGGLARGLARARIHELDRALNLVRAITHALDFAHGGSDFARAYRAVLKPTRDRELELSRALGLDVDLALAQARARVLDHARALAHGPVVPRTLVLARDFLHARNMLIQAANNFVGADFTTIDPAEVNLVGIRWDHETRWPTRAWADRIHRASVEDPPGSGVFVVRPEEGHNVADRGSLAPIS